MPRVFHDADAPLDPLIGRTVAVIGYGNQGRAWALNLRDSKVDVIVGTISDSSRDAAVDDGFESYEIDEAAREGDAVCLLIPDEIMGDVVRERVAPHLGGGDAVCFASGYGVAFRQVEIPDGNDVVLVAPRMIGVGVRDSYVEGSGFIAFVGVERDATGGAWPTALALARGIGATKRGALEMTFAQEAAIDLFVEQGIAPALAKVWRDAAVVLLEAGIPIEAILAEFYLSGEIERTYQAMREIGSSRQWKLHSMTSQYGTISRAERFADLETLDRLRAVLEEIRSGAFAREWAEERAAGYPRFNALREAGGHEGLSELEDQIRGQFEAPPP
jgi:ketol-acid reductoisomerase